MAHSRAEREAAFEAWVSAGCPAIRQFSRTYTRPDGSHYAARTLDGWCIKYSWNNRAQEIEDRAREQNEARLVQERADMIERHLQGGRQLQYIALQSLQARDNQLQNEFAILNAYKLGVDLELRSSGIAPIQIALSTATDEELQETARRLRVRLNRQNDEGFQPGVVTVVPGK